MSLPGTGLVLAAGEGGAIGYRRGGAITVKARAADTDGHYALLELTLPAGGGGAPLHRHRGEAEAFYALEGTFTFQLGAGRREVSAGSFVLVPRGLVHTFANAGDTPARCLVVISPAGFERYFEELGALVAASPDGEPEPALYRVLCEKYGQELV
jgi:quercetin dioxygenase-like cupin family protein